MEAIKWEKVAWEDIIPRLVLFAERRRWRFSTGMSLPSGEDLASSAIEKTISGTRIWKPERASLMQHLFGVVKSDLSNEIRKGMLRGSDNVDVEQVALQIASGELTPEELAVNRSVLEAFLMELKAKDPSVHKWFTLTAAYGLSEGDVQDNLGFGPKEIANMRRRLRRHIGSFVEFEGMETPSERSDLR